MKLVDFCCPRCGAPNLEKQDERWRCKSCTRVFHAETVTDIENIRKGLDEYKQELYAHARANLYHAVHMQHVDSERVIGYAKAVKSYDPENLLANFYELASGNDLTAINAFLDGVDVFAHADFLSDILEYMISSLELKNVNALKSLIDRAHNGRVLESAAYTDYITRIEDEAEKLQNGIYMADLPRDVFVAYSSMDMAEVDKLVDYLESEGLSCFVALRNLRHGKGSVENYQRLLNTAMHNCKCLVFVSTHNSRSLACDAVAIELPYIREHEPKMFRVEYRPGSDKGGRVPRAAEIILKATFTDLEYCRTIEDVLDRLVQFLYLKPTEEHETEAQRQREEEEKRLAAQREKEEAERKKREEEEKKREEEKHLAAQREKEEAEQKKRENLASQYAEKEETKEKSAEEVEKSFKEQVAAALAKWGTEIKNREEERRLEEIRRAEEEAEREERGEDAVQREIAERRKQLLDRLAVLQGNAQSFEIENGVLKKYKGAGGAVVIPDGVTAIGERAFCDCGLLTGVTVPDAVTSIGQYAFYNDSGLKSITIGSGVKSIAEDAFYHCSALETITVKKDNPVFHSRNNCLIETKSKTLLRGSRNSVIPKGVEVIGAGAFSGCEGLTSIAIPSGVTKIARAAFRGCNDLKSVTIPSSVTSIDPLAFEPAMLEAVTLEGHNHVYEIKNRCMFNIWDKTLVLGCESSVIPWDVTSIGKHAFQSCRGLKSITIPSSVTSIKDMAFFDCRSLVSVTLPSGLTSIGEHAFRLCSALKSLALPDSVTSIGAAAFVGCRDLASVTLPKRFAGDLERYFGDNYKKIKFTFTE